MDLSDRRRSSKIHEFYRFFPSMEKSDTTIDRIQKQTGPAPDLTNRSENLKAKQTRAELQWGGEEKQRIKNMAKIERK